MAAPVPAHLGHFIHLIRMAGDDIHHVDWLIAFPNASTVVKALENFATFTELVGIPLPPPPIGNRWLTIPNWMALRLFSRVFKISSSAFWAHTNLFDLLLMDSFWERALDTLCFAGLFQSPFYELFVFEEALSAAALSIPLHYLRTQSVTRSASAPRTLMRGLKGSI